MDECTDARIGGQTNGPIDECIKHGIVCLDNNKLLCTFVYISDKLDGCTNIQTNGLADGQTYRTVSVITIIT